MCETYLHIICRTCAIKHENLNAIKGAVINIGNNTKSVIEILNMINVIEDNNGFPDVICSDCLNKLTDVYKFILQCDRANLILKDHLENTINCEKCKIATKKEYENIEINEMGVATELNSSQSSYFKDKKEKTYHEPNEKINDLLTNKIWDITYKENDIVMLHEKCHQQENESVMCKLCKKKFNSKGSLNKHIKIHQDKDKNLSHQKVDNMDEVIPYICTFCSKSFKSKYILAVHEKRHIYKGQFLCTHCGKGFNSKGCLNRHMRVHTGEKRYECNVCKKKFPSSNNLNLHSRIHTGVKPYLCTICGKSFTHPTGLTYHLRTHTKEKKYTCDFCGKAFAIQCHLDNHRKIHTGERPFPCGHCDKAFIKKVDLQRHEAVHTGVKPYICGVCEKEFLRPLHLSYHMMIHTEERPHKCKFCGKGFIRRYYLKDHIVKHHSSTDSSGLC